jgi:TonB family protein
VEPTVEPTGDPATDSVVPAPPAPPEDTLPPMPVEAAAFPALAAPALTAASEAGESPAVSAAPEGVAAPAWPRTRLIALLAAVVAAAGVFGLIRWLSRPSAPPPLVSAQAEAAAQSPGTAAPATVSPGANTFRGAVPAAPVALHQVIPEVPLTARRTIRGHIKVWVRVVVDADGSVFAAVADRAGPSPYFQRLAVEAAKKWAFPPTEGPARRIMQVQFDFSRDGTTGRARPVNVPG